MFRKSDDRFDAGLDRHRRRANMGAMTEAKDADAGRGDPIHDDRLWRDNGWTARVVKNEDDEGWAVEMVKDGEPEPALVGPWTMGRDKRNPKPLDSAAFITLVKTAAEVIRRHEQHTQAERHKEVVVTVASRRVTVKLDVTADDDDPYAELSARDATGRELARVRVDAGFRLTAASASAWIDDGFGSGSRLVG
jgi:hypothetical protein